MILRCLFFLALLWTGLPAQAFPEFYTSSQLTDAKKEAAERNLPLAWLGGHLADLTDATPPSINSAQMEKMVIAVLQNHAVIIFFEATSEGELPPLVFQEFHTKDDGDIPGGHTWYTPKVVFTNADITEGLGRVSHSQMNQNGEGALNSALQVMLNRKRSAQAQTVAASKPEPEKPSQAPTKSNKEGEVVGSISNAVDFIDLVSQYRLTIVAVGLMAGAAFAALVWLKRRK